MFISSKLIYLLMQGFSKSPSDKSENFNDSSVSDVIGEILLLMILVILAAAIGASLFGSPQKVQLTKNVGISVELDKVGGNTVMITLHSGKDLDQMEMLGISVNGGTIQTLASTHSDIFIGKSFTYDLSGYSYPYHIMLIGRFSDNAEQILYDKIF